MFLHNRNTVVWFDLNAQKISCGNCDQRPLPCRRLIIAIPVIDAFLNIFILICVAATTITKGSYFLDGDGSCIIYYLEESQLYRRSSCVGMCVNLRTSFFLRRLRLIDSFFCESPPNFLFYFFFNSVVPDQQNI